jgi:DNA repair protein RadA/Sms
MSKVKTVFVCQTCGHQAFKWLGRCPGCHEWNSLVEEVEQKESKKNGPANWSGGSHPTPISEIETTHVGRIKTDIEEFDRVLGGGIVPGSLVLIGGDPGIGKSTLLLQALEKVALQGIKVLYVSGEESLEQTKMRGERLGVACKELFTYAETSLTQIIQAIERLNPGVVVIDSIQTLYMEELNSTPGSITQVRESAARLMRLAKTSRISVILIGHVTKEGAIAGPRVLEHMVDTVLYFEGESGHSYRLIRTVKNRFGSTNEIGVFEMGEGGLRQVTNPSELFLSERPLGVPGSCVVPSVEGTRPILIEVQALTASSTYAQPRRTAIGVDAGRVALLSAVLEKKLELDLKGQDIYINVAGGLKIVEPALDLGIIASMTSSLLNIAIPEDMIVFGEVGLTGEVRGVHQPAIRVREAERLGLSTCILPQSNTKAVEATLRNKKITLIGVKTVREAIAAILHGRRTK